jgi:Tfp pilus assembly protein PilF
MVELRKGPSDSPAADENIRGIAFLMQNDLSQAMAAFRRALDLDPSFAHARFNLGVLMIRQKDYAGARRELEAAAAGAPALALSAALHLGIAELGAGNLPQASSWLERVLAEEPDHADAHFHLGLVREAEGDLQAAGRAYRAFLQLRPESASGHLRFGVAALRSGKIETAKRYFRHTAELAPGSIEAAEAQKFLVIWD